MLGSRTYDTDALTIRTLFTYDPLNNIPYSSFSMPFVASTGRGLVTWASPDVWASSIQISSFNNTSLLSLLGAGDPTTLSNFVSNTVVSQGYATTNYVQSQLFFYTRLTQLYDIVQNTFAGFPIQGTNGYRTFTSSFTLPRSVYTTTTGLMSISSLANLSSFARFVDLNSRATLEFQGDIYVSTSATAQPVFVTSYFQVMGTDTILGDPLTFAYPNGNRSRSFTYQKTTLTNQQLGLGPVLSSIQFIVAVNFVEPSLQSYIEINTLDKNGFFFTLDNTYNGVKLPTVF